MQNACGKIREPMKIFYQHLKMNSAVKKIQNYGNKWLQHVWQMDRLPHWIIKYQSCGNRNQGHPPEDFQTVNGTRTGHEVWNSDDIFIDLRVFHLHFLAVSSVICYYNVMYVSLWREILSFYCVYKSFNPSASNSIHGIDLCFFTCSRPLYII